MRRTFLPILIILTAAFPTAFGQAAGRISVRVQDADTGDPIASALVWTADSTRSGRTDTDGRLTLVDLAAGNHRLLVSAAGYLRSTSDEVLLGASGTRTVSVSLRVNPNGPIAARRRLLPRIASVVGPNRLNVGQSETFRVRVSSTAEEPVEYRWDFGDGDGAEGNPVVHFFNSAGAYTVEVTARNRIGSQTASMRVEVLGPVRGTVPTAVPTPPSRPSTRTPAAEIEEEGAEEVTARVPRGPSIPGLHGGLIVRWAEGGLSWMVRTTFTRSESETFLRKVRAAGFRAGVIRDAEEGKGSPVFRVLVGQFQNEDDALRARQTIMATLNTPAIIWMVPASAGF